MIVSIVNGLLIFLLAVGCSFYTAAGKSRLPLISWSFLAIALVYGMGSIIVLTATYNGTEYLGSDIVLRNLTYWPFYGPLVILLMLGILLGWKAPIKKSKNVLNKVSRVTFPKSRKRTAYVAFFLLVLGFILRWLYVQAYGGFIPYLDYSRAIRSGVLEISNPYSFLQPFTTLIIMSSYFFWGLFIERYKPLLTTFGLLASVLFSFYILLGQAGRVGFVLYIANFLLAYSYIKGVSPKSILILSVLGFPIIIISLYYISLYFNIKGAESISYYFIKEVSFVFLSFFAQLSEGSLFRLFTDFIIAPLHLLPSSLTLGLYETASVTNTILISGAPKGEDGVTGGIPVDLLTLGVMQLNVLGILPVGFLFGFVIKRIDYLLNLINNRPISNILVCHYSLRLGFMGILYAHPPHFMGGIFTLVALLSILYIFNFPGRVKT